MQLTSTEQTRTSYPAFQKPMCPQCGEAPFAAAETEFHGQGWILNTWSCESCEHQFRTVVSLPHEN